MAGLDLAGLIKVGVDILTTTVSKLTKKIVAQLGSVEEETTDADNVEWWQHVGFASRPPKPDPKKKAAQAVTIAGGDRDVVIASQDLRGLELYGNLDHGETCLYAAGPDGLAQARVLLKKDGSINIFTKKGNAASGTGMGLFVNPDGSVTIVSHNGAAMMIGSDGSLKIFNGNGALQIDAGGAVKISGSKVSISAPAIILGGTVPGAVITSIDMLALIPIIASGISAAGPTGAGAAATFTAAAMTLVQGLAATKRTTAD